MEILKFLREKDEPVVTASEVAKEFGVTNEAANYRLKQLKQEGKVKEKKVGASAKVWYPVAQMSESKSRPVSVNQ